MEKIKSFTDLQQSKKLAEILPLESADMCYLLEHWVDENGDYREEWSGLPVVDDGDDGVFEPVTFPCWSLAALLGVLPDYTLQTNTDGTVFVVCDSKKPMISDAYDNPVDACVAIIESLHEFKML